MFPERFNNKTNGVTPRRWLLMANPTLSRAITVAIGDDWITDLGRLRALTPLAEDGGFQAEILKAKREAKTRFADWLKSKATASPRRAFLRFPEQSGIKSRKSPLRAYQTAFSWENASFV
jgi:glucan phosphorylase